MLYSVCGLGFVSFSAYHKPVKPIAKSPKVLFDVTSYMRQRIGICAIEIEKYVRTILWGMNIFEIKL